MEESKLDMLLILEKNTESNEYSYLSSNGTSILATIHKNNPQQMAEW
jgi:hypothetical protein